MMKQSELAIHTFILSDFQENCYVIAKKGSKECVVIDPGMEPESVVAGIRELGLTPVAILITHGHWDHIGGIDDLKKVWPDLPVWIGAEDRYKLTQANGNLSAMLGVPLTTGDADRSLNDGENIEPAGIPMTVTRIPGHSTGHVVYIIAAEDGPIVFAGDVLFSGSIGRTDFPDGNYADLLDGIRNKLFPLPDTTVVYSGHGPSTTIGKEKRSNPWLE